MNRGKHLQNGDTIGVVAPAGCVAAAQIDTAVQQLDRLGYHVVLGEGTRRQWYSYAGTDAMRAREINDFFRNPEIDAILCLRGGYGAIRLLPEIDYSIVRYNPKIFIGYSDITALHVAFNQLSELITFHGPMLASNFTAIDGETLSSLQHTLTDGMAAFPVENPAGSSLSALSSGVAEGIVMGGNLTTLTSLLGTPYAPDFTDKILFLEEIGEATYRIDRMLSQLKLAGSLDAVNGIILGDFNNCEPSSPLDMPLLEVFQDRLGGLGIPVIHNFQSGHCRPMMTLPLGARARIDGNHATIHILEQVVC